SSSSSSARAVTSGNSSKEEEDGSNNSSNFHKDFIHYVPSSNPQFMSDVHSVSTTSTLMKSSNSGKLPGSKPSTMSPSSPTQHKASPIHVFIDEYGRTIQSPTHTQQHVGILQNTATTATTATNGQAREDGMVRARSLSVS
ncbi:hypothetical protein ADUPG1_003704, partial [Aduncisulcus paluster]